jgi:FMN reductase
MTVLALSGSPLPRSPSSALTRYAAALLRERCHVVEALGVRDIPADDLIQSRCEGTAAAALRGWVEQAEVVLIGAPARNDCLSGVLISMLDLLGADALAGKLVLPLVTWACGARLIALERNVQTVLSGFGAYHFVPGLYVADTQIRLGQYGNVLLDGNVQRRLHDAVDYIARTVRPSHARRGPSNRIPFSIEARRAL